MAVILNLKTKGWSDAQIGRELRLTGQRIGQIAAGKNKRGVMVWNPAVDDVRSDWRARQQAVADFARENPE